MELVLRDGLDALTVSRLASAMDVAVGSLYRYFPSKEALVAALQQRAIAAFGEFLDERLAGPTDPIERLWILGLSWSAFCEEEPTQWALIDASLADPRPVLTDDLARQVLTTLDGVRRRGSAVLAEAAAAGALQPGDADRRFDTLLAAVYGVEHLRKMDRLVTPDRGSHQLRRTLLTTLFVGFGADPARVAATAR